MNTKNLGAIAKERRDLLNELTGYLDLMDDALKKSDTTLYEKLERDFKHLTEKLECVN